VGGIKMRFDILSYLFGLMTLFVIWFISKLLVAIRNKFLYGVFTTGVVDY
jgi:hypothetical protein